MAREKPLKFCRMNLLSRRFVSVLFTTILWQQLAEAQSATSGKMYAVVGCVAVILIGIVFFLFYLDKRLKKLEETEH